MPDDPTSLRLCAVSHELRGIEEGEAADLVARLDDVIEFKAEDSNWLGATRMDWRGRGCFRALTENGKWAVAQGYDNHRQDQGKLRTAALGHLQFNVISEPAEASRLQGLPQQAAPVVCLDAHQTRVVTKG